ncbi:MAG TPA: hypothetical protein VF525_18280 [Pyrinomonadaceae bacterium]|jgi:hypothetical protein
MKRHLLGLIIALLAFVLGLYIVVQRNPCKAPWAACQPAPPVRRATP